MFQDVGRRTEVGSASLCPCRFTGLCFVQVFRCLPPPQKTRYGTYAMLLRAKLSGGDDDLSAFESRLFDDGGLQRAHSSPTLPQDVAGKEKTRGSKTSKSLKVTSSISKTSGGREGSKEKNGGGSQPQPELQRPSSKQEEVA